MQAQNHFPSLSKRTPIPQYLDPSLPLLSSSNLPGAYTNGTEYRVLRKEVLSLVDYLPDCLV
jgi:hypothetical protein